MTDIMNMTTEDKGILAANFPLKMEAFGWFNMKWIEGLVLVEYGEDEVQARKNNSKSSYEKKS